ncbi:hypothetical protein CNYM01_00597 [Colletotrichum nymphaeae SA-01]|uniref:Uncharacterized protein n=1 Tax=Colletotrichum nymphaeae SA-01 TaxID=1460502 RepID=A0A135S3H8_9PEZI|nr:hypothetical protein CNYM01_00597 [Colletotrichum nymphaeae SA-01]
MGRFFLCHGIRCKALATQADNEAPKRVLRTRCSAQLLSPHRIRASCDSMTQAGKTLRMSALVRQTSHSRRLTCQRTIRNAQCGGQTTRLGLKGDKEFGVTTTTLKVSILPSHGVMGSSEVQLLACHR